MAYLLLAIIGAISGVMGSIVGLGGGTILVPLTLLIGIDFGLIPGITPQTVVGISVIMMIFNGLSSTLSHVKVKTVDYRTGWIFFAGSIPGMILGAFVNKGMDLPSFNLYFGILLIVLSILLLARKYLKPIQWFVQHGKPRTFVDRPWRNTYLWVSDLVCTYTYIHHRIRFRPFRHRGRDDDRTSANSIVPVPAACRCWYFDVHRLPVGYRELNHTYLFRPCALVICTCRHTWRLYWGNDRNDA